MGDIEDQFSLDPDGFEEIEEEIPEIEEDEEERITAIELNRRIVGTLERYTKCKFNRLAMESIEKRVREQVHGFMEICGIENPDELSLSNPPYSKKLQYCGKELSWWRFVDAIIRDAFPEFNFNKFAVNRIAVASLVIKYLIIPLSKGENPNIKLLEKEFNAKLLEKLASKRNFIESQDTDDEEEDSEE